MRFMLALIAACAATAALAHDPQHHVDGPTLNWFQELQNQRGWPCCDGTDGTRLEDPDWRMVEDKYQVRLEGVWRDVPPEALITQRNRVGYAMVWVMHNIVRCFMPGTET
jgi:hypothetical protein